jgi:hypothetical protein
MTITVEDLITEQTQEEFFETGLAICTTEGLATTTWRPGDFERSVLLLESQALADREALMAGYIRSGFLDFATGVWLKVIAEQVYRVTVPEATSATCEGTLTNPGGGFYTIDARSLTFSSSTTGKTYSNTTGGVLAIGPGTTLTITVEATETGSASSAGVGDIDTLVTPLGTVTFANTTAALGADEQNEAVTRQQCRDKLASLSPNGAAGAYSYVARNSELTGVDGVTRVREFDASDTGEVQIYLAKASAGVSSDERDDIEEAILTNCTPLCITPIVTSASTVTIAITYAVWIYSDANKTSAEIEAAIETALTDLLSTIPIGGDIIPPALTGALYQSAIIGAIRSAFPEFIFRVTIATPAGDTSLTNSQIPLLGTVTPTINIVSRNG